MARIQQPPTLERGCHRSRKAGYGWWLQGTLGLSFTALHSLAHCFRPESPRGSDSDCRPETSSHRFEDFLSRSPSVAPRVPRRGSRTSRSLTGPPRSFACCSRQPRELAIEAIWLANPEGVNCRANGNGPVNFVTTKHRIRDKLG